MYKFNALSFTSTLFLLSFFFKFAVASVVIAQAGIDHHEGANGINSKHLLKRGSDMIFIVESQGEEEVTTKTDKGEKVTVTEGRREEQAGADKDTNSNKKTIVSSSTKEKRQDRYSSQGQPSDSNISQFVNGAKSTVKNLTSNVGQKRHETGKKRLYHGTYKAKRQSVAYNGAPYQQNTPLNEQPNNRITQAVEGKGDDVLNVQCGQGNNRNTGYIGGQDNNVLSVQDPSCDNTGRDFSMNRQDIAVSGERNLVA